MLRLNNTLFRSEIPRSLAAESVNVRETNIKEFDPSLGDVNIYELPGILKEAVEMI